MEVFERRHDDTFEVRKLTMEQRQRIIVDYLAQYHKTLLNEQISRIASDENKGNPLILRTLLDELRMFGVHEELDNCINTYLEPTTDEDFFSRVLQRIENSFGADPVKRVLIALAVSRNGLLEQEIQLIAEIAPVFWSQIYGALSSHLVNRAGFIDFSHGMIRTAVLNRYEDSITVARRIIVAYFEVLKVEAPEQYNLSRACFEVPWQLQILDETQKLKDFILDFDVLEVIYWKNKNEMCSYWKYLFDHGIFPKEYLAVDLSAYSKKEQAYKYYDLGHFCTFFQSMSVAEEAYDKALAILRELARENPQVYHSDLATTLNNLALLHDRINEKGKAEAEYEEALAINRELARENPQVYHSDLAATLHGLAYLHDSMNEKGKAEAEYQEALAIRRELARENPRVYHSDLAATLNNLALLHDSMNEKGKAEAEYMEALAIYRELVRENPRVYHSDLALTLNNLAGLHNSINEKGKAEAEFKEALAIYRELARENPQVYHYDLANTACGLAQLYANTGEKVKAKETFMESLKAFKELAEIDYAQFQSDVEFVQQEIAKLGL